MIGILLAIAIAFIFPGVIIRVKSLLSGRQGPGIFQPVKNILLLLRKGSVFSETTSYIFRIAPVIYLSTILMALLLLPFPGMPSLFSFQGDFVLFACLLGMGKFFFIIGAMDTGSSFEGMGASREAFYSMLVEPAFLVIIGCIAMITGQTSLQDIFTSFRFNNEYTFIIGAAAIYILIQVTMIENSRMPVDDPKTHLELTMIHEVMILDHSGFDLALIQIAGALKFVLYGALIAACVIPVEWPLWLQVPVFLLVQVAFASLIGMLESFRARKKMKKNPQFIVTLSSVALIAFVMCLLIIYKMNK